MGDVLIAEETDGGQDRVRSRLTKAAECVLLDVIGELFELVDVFQGAFAFGDAVEDLEHSSGTDTAGRTFTAGLVDGELQEELRDVDHAVVFVHDDESAGTHDGSDLGEVLIVHLDVDVRCGDTAAGRAAGLRRFEFLAVRDTAADFFDDGAKGGAHRDLDEAGVLDLAAEGEDLGTLGLLGTHGREPFRTVDDDLGDVRPGLNVVQDGRALEQTLFGRERRTGTGLTAVAFDGGHEGSFFTADERTGAETDVDIEIEPGLHDVLAEEAVLMGLVEGDLQTLDRDRVLCADVDVTLVRADRVTGDGHGFEDHVGVAFQDGTVHEGTGVAFVRVTADELLRCVIALGEFPLEARRETGAAASAEAGVEHDLDDVVRSHLLQDFLQGDITVHRQIFIDALRVDEAAVLERDSLLDLVEARVVQRGDLLVQDFVLVDQTFHDTALQEVLFDDFGDVIDRDTAVEDIAGVDDHDGAEFAETEAAGLNDLDFILEAFRHQFFFHGLL